MDQSPAPDRAPLAGDSPAARHRLPARVVRYWRWRAFFGLLPLVVVLVGVLVAFPVGPPWVCWGVGTASCALVATLTAVLTRLRHRVFWYAISPTEIDLQHGIVFIARSVVPMHRVQDLRIGRGPVADRFRVANVKIRTAGGSVGLRGLDRDEATGLCDRVSRLARLADDV